LFHTDIVAPIGRLITLNNKALTRSKWFDILVDFTPSSNYSTHRFPGSPFS